MRTTDLYLAVYLRCKGFKNTFEWKNGKAIFIFDPSSKEWVEEFHDGNPQVHVRKFISELLKFKDEMFATKP